MARKTTALLSAHWDEYNITIFYNDYSDKNCVFFTKSPPPFASLPNQSKPQEL
jgi:hypothetical protein